MSEMATWDGRKGHYERMSRYPSGDYGHEEEDEHGSVSSRDLSRDEARRWLLENDYELPMTLPMPMRTDHAQSRETSVWGETAESVLRAVDIQGLDSEPGM